MVRLEPVNGLFVSVSALIALCVKQANRVSRRFGTGRGGSKTSPKSPLSPSKQLLTTISNKAIPFLHKKRSSKESEAGDGEKAEEGFGDGGLWQRDILMGEKCQPPDFSGVIYYDINGNKLSELPPRSPRNSPLPRFSSPEAKHENYYN
ncbi:hypothetical protein HHK36_024326 [Tetracentron sinense]|uniref:Uncharacterized protein n=1 Tax=Tetracentron sinense TaxID=13715 RepID=A0A835D6L1_TETSI|nr:hypothetical protein HHK36_024326 [Tetracentron sinense]